MADGVVYSSLVLAFSAEKRGAPGNGAAVTHSSGRLFNYSTGHTTNNSIYIDDKY